MRIVSQGLRSKRQIREAAEIAEANERFGIILYDMGIASFEPHNRDSKDFHNFHISYIRKMLQAAYDLGKAAK